MIKANIPLEVDNKVILREPAPANYHITIEGMPNDDEVIIIKVDEFKSPDTIFYGTYGECKRADFVIIAETSRKKVILCIEMKAGQGGTTTDILHQLEGAKCFAAYCREIGQTFWGNEKFLINYEHRFVSIKNIKLSKTKPLVITDISSKAKLIMRSGKTFQFNDLIQCKK
jgi:hypothetical protein